MVNQSINTDEELTHVAGHPALIYFKLGEQAKNLVVFASGGYHLARISYGLPNSSPKDFIAYWLQQKGYSFLGLSYPLDHAVFEEVYPTFNITDWAQQIVQAAKQKIVDNHLANKFIMLGWSMAGKTVSQVNQMAQAAGLELIYISLASSPPINGLIATDFFNDNDLIKQRTTKDLSSKEPITPWFLDQLHEQNQLNNHVIMDDATYVTGMLGDHPINLPATNLRCEQGKFVEDISETLHDTMAMHYACYPMLGLITSTSRSDYINSLFNSFDWAAMQVRVIFNKISHKINMDSLTTQQWDDFKHVIQQLPQLLYKQVEGGHAFFLGERGAQQTVAHMESLVMLIEQLNNINSIDALCELDKG